MKIKILLYITVIALCFSCTKGIYYGPEAGEWEKLSLPDSTKLAYTVYLVGDVGAPSNNPYEPTLKLLKQQLDADSNSTLVVLGDNLYHDGLSAEGTANRARDEQRLNDQTNVVADHKGKVFFVPGNHDWDYMGPRGLEKIRRQEQYVEQSINKGNTFVPDNGCPGPFTETVSKDVVFIGLDTQWWLHKHEKPYGPNSGCSAGNEAEMLAQIERILEKNRGKHIVVSGHHPFVSNSNHGGYYFVRDHLFPLQLIRDGLYIPMPVIGSLYPFYRQFGGVDQDIAHYRYQLLISQLTNIFNRYDNIVYTAGHEHVLQLHKLGNFTHITSGSGCKTSPIVPNNSATYAHAQKGFAKMLYYENGEAWVEFWMPEGDGATGKTTYRGKLYNRIQTRIPAESICVDSVPFTTIQATPATPKNTPYAFTTAFLKDDYSQEWRTPIQLPYLNLGKVGGGVTPVGLSGDKDRFKLRLMSRNNYEYSFKPLLRNVLLTVPQQYRSSVSIESVAETWLPSQHPYAPLIAAPLEQAAGLLSAEPKLYAIPDVTCLEPYRERFKNRVGFLEPDAEDYGNENSPSGRRGIQEINYSTLIYNLEADHLHQVDARAFAKVRLMDMLLGDWDRYEEQYEWGIVEEGNKTRYLPIPEGRDNAFFAFNGALPWLVSRAWGIQELQHFGYTISHIKGLTYSARNLDRRLLGSLSADDWKQTAQELEQALTDKTIAAAVRNMPAEVYDLHGDVLVEKLKARRGQLSAVAAEYSELLAEFVNLYGSSKKERFEVERLPNGDTRVRIFAAEATATPFVDRTFSESRTKEIRLYGLGGDDVYRVTGSGGSKIKVRIIGYKEQGRYQYAYTDTTLTPGSSRTYTVQNELQDKNLEDNTTSTYKDFASGNLISSPASDDFEYTHLGPSFSFLYNSSDGLVLGAGLEYRPYKFRTSPFGGLHRLLYQRAFKTNAARILYEGEVKNFALDLDFVSRAWVYAPYYSMPFRGYGNTPASASEVPNQRVEFSNISISTALQKPFGTFFAIGGGPMYEFYRLSERKNAWVQELLPDQSQRLFGQHNYLGALGYFKLEVMDNRHNPLRGLVVNLQANWMKGFVNTSGRYSRYTYEVRYYMTPVLPFQLTFAGRLGGAANTGDYNFYQGNMVGGGVLPDFSQTIRGFSQTRLIGDRSLYSNLEVRASLIDYRLYFFPGKLGVLGLFDNGRVWTRTNHEGGWHTAYGGGLWVSLFNRVGLTATAAHSREGTFFNIQNGFYF